MRVTFVMIMGIERPSGRRYMAIARELVRLGLRVRILALHPDLENCPERRFVRDGVEVWYVGQMHSLKRGGTTIPFTSRQLLAVLARSTLGMIQGILCSPSDVFHLGKPQPVNGLAALVGCTLRGKRFFVDCDDEEVESNRLSSSAQRAVFAFWQWLLPLLATGVSVNTTFLAERMRRKGIRRVALVPNGVDRARFARPPEEQLAALRSALGLHNRQIIGYVGALSLQNHPVDLLIDAFALAAPRLPHAALLIVGGGEDRSVLQERVIEHGLQDRVYFCGEVSHTAARHLLALATISVDPVHNDRVAQARSPLKLAESMAVGVPVVTCDVGDRALALAHGGGFLAAPGSAAALAEALERALADPQALQEASAAALQAAQQLDWALLAEHWLALYSR